jgi:two-component system phosphate regulon sensor histidine kinase PhoR
MKLYKSILEKIIRSVGEAVIVTDQDNFLVLMNRVAEDFFGIKERQVLGKNVLLEIEDSVFAAKWIEFLLRDVDVFNQEITISYPALRTLSATHSKLKDEKGNNLGSVSIFRDISGTKEVERLQKDVVSKVSHEFRGSLASIKFFLDTVIRSPEMPVDERSKSLKMAEEESLHLGSLVEDLLDLSKMEAGKLFLNIEKVSLDELVANSVFVLQPLFEKKGVHLEVSVPKGNYGIALDKDKFIRVIHNLLSNALKFTPEEGKATVSLRKKKSEMVLEVNDTGIGIPKEDLPNIFNKFYRVRRGETVKEGTGLGLSIVKELVELHKGTIRIESQEGEGTTVTVTLPR